MVLDVPLCIGVAWGCILYSVMEFSDASSLPYLERPLRNFLHGGIIVAVASAMGQYRYCKERKAFTTKAKNGNYKANLAFPIPDRSRGPRIFGGFLEHMGRAVYQGVYEPESPPHKRGSIPRGCPLCPAPPANDHDALSGRELRLWLSLDRWDRSEVRADRWSANWHGSPLSQSIWHGGIHPLVSQNGLDAHAHRQPGNRYA